MKIADNLILCATPLQVLIAEKIIEKYPNESFSLIMITYSKNEKYLYYFNRLKNKCKTAKLLNINGKWSTLFYVVYFRLSMLDKNAKRVFLSNIDNIIFQTILSMLDKTEVYTFDDGTANIDKTSFFYRDNQTLKQRIVKKILGINLTVDGVKRKSIKHYTLYRYENIISNLEYIDLLPITVVNRTPTKTVRIYLGQPLFEVIDDSIESKNKLNIDITERAIKYSNTNLYFPHPREKYKIENVSYIKTDLIFEDYIVEEIKKNPNTMFEVYTFFSTAGLNIANIPNVKVFYLRTGDIPSYWNGVYNLLNRMKIEPIQF